MAISWAQGLLAGAAGVAEYSNQEQKRRQKREDRTQELRDNMRKHQAESMYSIKLNEYKQNKNLMKSLSSVEAGSVAEQILIAKANGNDQKTANFLAQRAIASGNLMQRPATMEVPEFVMTAMEPGKRARSPIQEWVRSYMNEENTRDTQGTPEAEDQAPQAPQAPQATQATQEPTETQGLSPQDSQFLTGAKPLKVSTHWNETVVDGKRVVIPQHSDESGKTWEGDYIKLGSDLPKDATIKFISNGQETDVYAIGKDNKLEFIQSVASASSTNASTKEPKGLTASTSEINSFVEKQYDNVFSGVQDKLESTWGSDNEESKKMKVVLSSDYLNTLKNLRVGMTPNELIERGQDTERQAQAIAITRNLPEEQLIDLLLEDDELDGINPEIFKGPQIRRLAPVLLKLKTQAKRTYQKEIVEQLDGYLKSYLTKGEK